MNTVETTIRAYLDQHGSLTYRISGVSMMPMLRQEKDLVTLRRYNGEGLKKYDVAMYDRGGPRRYVLHRVVEVHEGHYTFLGDNCVTLEKQIPEEAIVAVLTSFTRDGRTIPVTDKHYKLYSRARVILFPIWLRKAVSGLRKRLSGIPWLRKCYRAVFKRSR